MSEESHFTSQDQQQVHYNDENPEDYDNNDENLLNFGEPIDGEGDMDDLLGYYGNEGDEGEDLTHLFQDNDEQIFEDDHETLNNADIDAENVDELNNTHPSSLQRADQFDNEDNANINELETIEDSDAHVEQVEHEVEANYSDAVDVADADTQLNGELQDQEDLFPNTQHYEQEQQYDEQEQQYDEQEQQYDEQEQQYDELKQREHSSSIEQGNKLGDNNESLLTNGLSASETVGDVVCSLTIYPEQFTHTDTFPSNFSISALKRSLSKSFKISANDISVNISNQDVEGLTTLGQLCKIHTQHSDNIIGTADYPLELDMYISSSVLSDHADPAAEGTIPVDIIRVDISNREGPANDETDVYVFVKLIKEYATRQKPFLGGYRNKRNGATFHHATTQTLKKKKPTGVARFHRETQTVKTSTKSQQTTREVGIQMNRTDYLVNTQHDYEIAPETYQTAQELALIKHDHAKDIQCFVRMCFAHRRIRRLEEQQQLKQKEEEDRAHEEAEAKRKEVIRQTQRRMNPRTKEDFDTLYRELEAWKVHEIEKVKNSGLPQEQVQFQLQEILGKELVVLQITERLKIDAAKKNKEENIKETLEKMSSPKAWSVDGNVVEVETPYTLRAKELVLLYNGLTKKLPQHERVDVLLHIKYTVKEFDCELTREIVDLVQREEDLIKRCRSEQSMSSLRKRLAQLFLEFVHTPEFNPESATYLKAPYNPVKLLNKK